MAYLLTSYGATSVVSEKLVVHNYVKQGSGSIEAEVCPVVNHGESAFGELYFARSFGELYHLEASSWKKIKEARQFLLNLWQRKTDEWVVRVGYPVTATAPDTLATSRTVVGLGY